MRSQRQLRVGEEIRHALAIEIQRGDIPWPAGFKPPMVITVTEVQMSPDLHNGTVFVMPLRGELLKETIKALNTVQGHFRHVIAKEVRLRAVPKLTFAADMSFEYAQRITDLLHDPVVKKDLERPDDDPDDDPRKDPRFK
jgi:ribosome-binding factor A